MAALCSALPSLVLVACVYNHVVFVIYCIPRIVGYFHNVFYNDDAAAVQIIGADLFVCGIIKAVAEGRRI